MKRFLLLLIGILILGQAAAAITASRVTATTAATLLYTAATGGSTVLIRNVCAASVYLGASTVTTATGFEVGANDAITLPMGPGDTVYGVVASGTCVEHILESRR